MHDDHFAAMIHGLETLGVTRTQIAQNCGISTVTVWRMAEIRDWKPTGSTVRRVEAWSKEVEKNQGLILRGEIIPKA